MSSLIHYIKKQINIEPNSFQVNVPQKYRTTVRSILFRVTVERKLKQGI